MIFATLPLANGDIFTAIARDAPGGGAPLGLLVQDETDPGTRIFIRQLIEMYTANLRLECQNLRMIGDLCNALEALVDAPTDAAGTGDAA